MKLYVTISMLLLAGVVQAASISNGDFTICPGAWSAANIDGAGGCTSGGYVLNDGGGDVLPNPVPRIWQTVSGLLSGHNYSVTGDYSYYWVTRSGLNFGVEIDGHLWEFQPTGNIRSGTFNSFDVQFTYAGGSSVLRLTGQRHDDVDIWVDNIAIRDLGSSSVPEPSTWLLLGAGLACLAARRRR